MDRQGNAIQARERSRELSGGIAAGGVEIGRASTMARRLLMVRTAHSQIRTRKSRTSSLCFINPNDGRAVNHTSTLECLRSQSCARVWLTKRRSEKHGTTMSLTPL